jgi:ubiquinone/menaquinone biosynthesis C-methylase UbiE
MKQQRLAAFAWKDFPWGKLFAARSNFEYGYFTAEKYLVAKYLRSPQNVLVIGSGNGREARPIYRQAKKIVCIDTGGMYLLSAQKLFKTEGIDNTVFVQADMFHLPFAKKSFNFVFFSLYSFSKENRFNVLKNIRSILRPSGLILLSCCTPLYQKLYKLEPSERAFISTAKELSREVSSCGFELLETRVDKKRPEYRFSILRVKG